MQVIVIGVFATLLATPAFAQSGSAPQTAQPPTAGGVLVRVAQNGWANAKRNIVESADQMPEALLAQPGARTPDRPIRTTAPPEGYRRSRRLPARMLRQRSRARPGRRSPRGRWTSRLNRLLRLRRRPRP